METLGDAFPKEQARVREILGYYQALGPAGAFGAGWIQELLRLADRAALEQDTVAMLALYPQLKAVE